jgi:phosphotransferase system enzyme I (PtsI)
MSMRVPSGDPLRERLDLEAAVGEAIAAIRALIERSGDGDAAAILEFQVAMLEDDTLIAPAFAAIAGGKDAVRAWHETIDAQIADYQDAADEYFRARVADLRDLRDEVIANLSGVARLTPPEGAVIAADDVTPSRFLSVDWSRGGAIALCGGSPSSHVAMLARSRGVPMVVGLGPIDLDGHASAIVDGDRGSLVLSPGEDDWSTYATARNQQADRARAEAAAALRPAVTQDGVRIAVMINIAEPEELDALEPAICDGIGLVRTELLFHRGAGLPDEESQYRAYRRIAEWAAPRPVVLRTLDAGGDKPIAGLTIPGESNPFLGTRGIRLSLARLDAFRAQLRAMARAAAHGNVKIMLPMVTLPQEIDAAAAILDKVVAELAAGGIEHKRPPLGIMVEVPAVAIVPELYGRAAFFSIGSNDLTQYVTAAARDISAVATLNDARHPAVASLIARVVAAGAKLGIDVSLCGDMGGDPQHLPTLLGAGIRTVSVAPSLVGRVKRGIASLSTGG